MPRTELCKVCAPLDVLPTLEGPADPEVGLELPSFLPLLFRPPHLYDAHMPLQLEPHGMVPCVDSTSSSIFEFMFFLYFSPFTRNLIVHTSILQMHWDLAAVCPFTMRPPVLVNCTG